MPDHTRSLEHLAEEFLHEQLAAIQHKITRLDGAVQGCDESPERCHEADGLRAMRHSALIEQEVITALLAAQHQPGALSLDAEIMDQIRRLRATANRAPIPWRRGAPTPPAYWDGEVRQTVLADLLRRYHAWVAHRPLYGPAARTNPLPAHPWYPDWTALPAENSPAPTPDGAPLTHLESVEALRAAVLAQLARFSAAHTHIEIIPQPNGEVVVTGNAHSAEEREAVLAAILRAGSVRQVVADVKIVAADRCPVCHPAE